jgi:AraC-like DNA-binding protein
MGIEFPLDSFRRSPPRRPLLQYGALEFTSPTSALEFCEASFERVKSFRFARAWDNLLSTAGPAFAGCRMATVASTGHEISLDEDNDYTLLLPLIGKVAVSAGNIDRSARPGEMLVAGNLARTTTLSEGYLGVLLKVPVEKIAASLHHRGLDASLGEITVVADRGEAGIGSTLRSFVLHLLDELDQRRTLTESEQAAASAVTLLQDFIVQWQADIQAEAPGRTRIVPASPRSLCRAEEFMRANSGEPLNIDEIASIAGVSVRSLQMAFRRYRKMTPHAFLNRCRLQRAHERLRVASPRDNVTTIAFDCGFTHLGRFAAAYARIFGERPSATLKRSAG